ncbi:MAG: 3-hydroxyacyl-CoA dehydrogenase NAD-binding domain-containing protein, partial [Gemmatimonadota bacterium]
AEVMVAKDLPVLLKDIREEALEEALHHARSLLDKGRRKGVFEEHEVGLKFARIEPTLEYDGFGDVDLVVEAVVEEMEVKKQVLAECEERLPGDAVFTTNTSSLSVTELATAADRPENVAGLHFFNPAHKMPLVEVVRGEETSDETLATAFEFARDLGKTPVIVADEAGFLVNRLLAPYMNEAVRLLEDGVGVEALDRAISDFGMPMGPCRLLDEVGLDIAGHVREQLEDAFGERMAAPDLVDRLVEDGRLGKKNGRGFYRYEDGERQGVDPDLQRRLESIRGQDREMDPEVVRRRCLFPMVNEAAHALEEDVARSADDVDLALVTGTGFPPFRGGLLRWADSVGVATIESWLSDAADRLGPRYRPASLLTEMAREERRFTDSG